MIKPSSAAGKNKKAFDKKLEFDVQLLPYKGNDAWVEKTILAAHKCLHFTKVPAPKDVCPYCEYVKDAAGEL